MKHIVLGTAGHIDHGKTALVKALTGIDLDSLKEEKERGITIENGYTYLDIDEGSRVALIDVPGHEKFIKNMIGGAASIDGVIFIIAADEGVMPQSKEHLNVLKLLGIKSGIIVISKIDLVDDEIIQLVKEDIEELVKGSFLEKSKVIEVSSKDLRGIKDLKEEIKILSENVREKNKEELFRMPIDRIFTVKGIGTIVTGTILSGSIEINEEIEINPGNIVTKVRTMEVHNKDRKKSVAGERCAINLPNIKKEQLKRGMVLGETSKERVTKIIDCSLTMVSDLNKELLNRDRVRIYNNTKELLGRIILLDRELLKAKEKANVQIRLEEDLCCRVGDKIIIRTYSPMITIGGATILENMPKKAKRFNEDYIENLKLKEGGTLEQRVEDFIKKANNAYVKEKDILDKFNLSLEDVKIIKDRLLEEKKVILINSSIMIHSSILMDIINLTEETLREYYNKNHLKYAMKKEEFKNKLTIIKLKGSEFNDLLKILEEKEVIGFDEDKVYLYNRKVKLSTEEEAIEDKLLDSYLKDGLKSRRIEEVLKEVKNYSLGKKIYEYLLDKEQLIYIGDNITLHKEVLEKAKLSVIGYIKDNGSIELQEMKILVNTSRKYLVAILEYLDREKVTKRVEEKRVLI